MRLPTPLFSLSQRSWSKQMSKLSSIIFLFFALSPMQTHAKTFIVDCKTRYPELFNGSPLEAAEMIQKVEYYPECQYEALAQFTSGPMEKDAVGVLIDLISASTTRVQTIALRAISAYGSSAQPALEQLLQGLQSSNEQIQIASARAIPNVRPNPNLVVGPLLSALNRGSLELARRSARALASLELMPSRYLPDLMFVLANEKLSATHYDIAVAITHLPEEEAARALVTLVASSQFMEVRSVAAIHSTKFPAALPLLQIELEHATEQRFAESIQEAIELARRK